MTHRSTLALSLGLLAAAGRETTPTSPSVVALPDPMMIRVPSPFSGTFDVTLDLDASCAVVPPGERSRRYTATVGDLGWAGVYLLPQDEARGGHIVERLASGGWLEITGTGGGEVLDYNDFTLTLQGQVWYCPSAVDFPFAAPCAGGTGSAGTARSCEGQQMQLRFTRR
jgi:hypothetical protein